MPANLHETIKETTKTRQNDSTTQLEPKSSLTVFVFSRDQRLRGEIITSAMTMKLDRTERKKKDIKSERERVQQSFT